MGSSTTSSSSRASKKSSRTVQDSHKAITEVSKTKVTVKKKRLPTCKRSEWAYYRVGITEELLKICRPHHLDHRFKPAKEEAFPIGKNGGPGKSKVVLLNLELDVIHKVKKLLNPKYTIRTGPRKNREFDGKLHIWVDENKDVNDAWEGGKVHAHTAIFAGFLRGLITMLDSGVTLESKKFKDYLEAYRAGLKAMGVKIEA